MSEERSLFSLPRRDFLFGAAAGFVGTKAVEWALPFEMALASMPKGTRLSYSQCGEDVIVEEIFKDIGVQKPTYLDIGAYLPIYANNTYLFHRAGGHGVLVEPNVSLIPELERERPGDVVLNVGIGFEPEETTADYFVLTLPEWNTFDREEAERRVRESDGEVRIEEVKPLRLVPLNRVLEEHFGGKAPDFLTTDTEGLDLAILKTLDFGRFRPRVICTEFPLDDAAEQGEIRRLLTGNGYELRATTLPNQIFTDARPSG